MKLIVLAIFLPFIFGVTIAFVRKNLLLRNTLLMVISIFDFAVILSLANPILNGELEPLVLIDIKLFKLVLAADPLALLMGTLVSFLWIFTNSYSIGYMAGEHAQPRYFSALTLCLGATVGIIFSANLATFFIFYEVLTIAVYPLVIHEETEEAFRAGVVYLVFLLFAGASLLFAILLTYVLADGNLTFTPGGITALAHQSKPALYFLFALFVLGFGVKGALMPLHAWLPRAMVAPTPVSALLHAVAVVNMGLYGFIRMIYNVFGPHLFRELHLNWILAAPAIATILLAAIAALRVERIKRLLAYSTINQLSYVILGASSLHPFALLGALVHIVYHSLMKITLFYSAGTIIKQTGKVKIKEMVGLAQYMPITSAAFLIGALGILGLPPIAGWVSKWYIIEGFFKIGRPFSASVFIISTIIEVAFLAPPIMYTYFGRSAPAEIKKMHKRIFAKSRFEAPLGMLIPLIVVMILSVTFGLFGSLPFIFGKASVATLLP